MLIISEHFKFHLHVYLIYLIIRNLLIVLIKRIPGCRFKPNGRGGILFSPTMHFNLFPNFQNDRCV